MFTEVTLQSSEHMRPIRAEAVGRGNMWTWQPPSPQSTDLVGVDTAQTMP